MPKSYRLKRFTNAAILRRIDFPLLAEFFESDPSFVEFLSQRGMQWTSEQESFDYDALARILMDPGVDTPEDLLDALYFVDSLTDDESYDRILGECAEAGIDLGAEDLTPEELTLRVWLADRNVLEKIHAEQYRTHPKRFESFFARLANPPDFQYPSPEVLAALEDSLNAFYEFKKKGRGARVFPFVGEDGVWFLVRHGQRLKREGTLEADGSSGSAFFRPEKFDVLIYYPREGELTISTTTKGERENYCTCFGRHLFGDDMFFRFTDLVPKYTLRALIDRGPAVLACGDIAGLKAIRFSELHINHAVLKETDTEIRRADDVFRALDKQSRTLRHMEDSRRLVRAKFVAMFDDGRERTITVEPPNIGTFERDTDSTIIQEWMAARGLVCSRTTTEE